MKYSRRLDYIPALGERNSQIEHPEFDDSVITSVHEMLVKFGCGELDERAIRHSPVVYSPQDFSLDDNISSERMDYDILDALDDSEKINKIYKKAKRVPKDSLPPNTPVLDLTK